MVALLTAQVLLGWIKDLMILRTGQRIDAELILGYYRHLLRLPQRFFDTMRVGEIVSRVNDAVKIRAFINDVALDLPGERAGRRLLLHLHLRLLLAARRC